jgi:hypothetical protein
MVQVLGSPFTSNGFKEGAFNSAMNPCIYPTFNLLRQLSSRLLENFTDQQVSAYESHFRSAAITSNKRASGLKRPSVMAICQATLGAEVELAQEALLQLRKYNFDLLARHEPSGRRRLR